MTVQGWFLILAFTGILLALTKPMGLWLHALYEGRRTPLHVVLGPIERGFYRLSGIDPDKEQDWRGYAAHMLIFSTVSLLLTYAVLRLQFYLPLNLDVPERQREADVHHHHQADHLRRRVEVAEWTGWFARAGHRPPLPYPSYQPVHLL